MADNYIGANGLVTQSLEEIRTQLINEYKEIYGANINVEQNSPDGQKIGIEAQAKKDILDLITQIYNNLDVDAAIGLPLQKLCKLNGLSINNYSYSYVDVDVTCTEPVNLTGLDDNIDNPEGTGYTVTDTNGNRWILASSQSLNAGTHNLAFRAADLGGIESLPNTITIAETVLKGISSINNPAKNYITGNTGETDAQFRTRRNKALAVASQGFDESIQSQLLNLDTVTQAIVYDNRTNATVNNIPPHTVWVIVQGGQAEDIGRIIYVNLPPGIPAKGSESVTITKSNGDLYTVYFDRPTAIPLYLTATIKNFVDTPIDEDYVKEQLVSNLSFNIKQRVTIADISQNLQEILTQTATPYDIGVSMDGETYSDYVEPTNLDEYFSLSTDNITLTVV